MASSPPAAHYPSIPNTKKRPSLSTQGSTTASKRPRLSHPLRQTSFPAVGESTGYYTSADPTSARSETGSISASVVSAASTTTTKRGRGRPRKSATINFDGPANDKTSAVDGTGRTTKAGGGGARSVVSGHHNDADNNAPADDDEDDAADEEARFQQTNHTDAEEYDERQIQRVDKLKSALDQETLARLEKWRAVNFPSRFVRKLVNQIVSQSVTESPINAVRVYAKWYAAEIVERARQVQEEWREAYEKVSRHAEKADRETKLEDLRKQLRKADANTDITTRWSEYDRRRFVERIERARKFAAEYVPNPHAGGLLPDHLREALRRYKSDGEGGGVGFDGLSHPLLGVAGSKVWGQGNGAIGKRLLG